MNKFSFFALAIAGLLFAACSFDKDVAVEDQPGEVLPEGYMALNINLPTTPQVRAANDDFDDGTADEYKVTDCALLLFEGESESTATLFRAQSITLPTGEADVDKDNITTSYLATASVKGRRKSGGKLYALVLLNHSGVLSSINNEGLPVFTGSDDALTKEATLATIRALKISGNTLTGNNASFFMTNAVLSDKPGGPTDPSGANITQLAELDPTKVFDTEEKAKANPAGDILVERAVAKATLAVGPSFSTTIAPDLTISKIEWAIDNMQPETYIFRNPGDNTYITYRNAASDNYRFVGNATTLNQTTLGTTKSYYRTYWCIDPMYDKEAPVKGEVGYADKNYMLSYSEGDFKQIYPTASANTTAFYCYENTFNVAHQSYKNTTRAIIRVTLSSSSDIYTVNGSSTPVSEDVAAGRVKSYIITNTEVQKAFKDQLQESTETMSYTIDEKTFDISFERSATGQYAVKTLTLSTEAQSTIGGSSGGFKTDAVAEINKSLAGLIKGINDNIVIFKYVNGIMYYEARFKHFAGDGDADLAPWNTTEYGDTEPQGGSVDNAYPAGKDGATAEQNYLGRYGMVRNNWYDVTVTAINGFGYPEIPSVTVKNPGYDDPDTPDDNLKENIAVKIHVLSWAKRTQSWGF